jgi:hypothetical protein
MTVNPGGGGGVTVLPQISVGDATANPPSVTVGGVPDTSTIGATISASPATPGGLQSGDYVHVEMINETGGGNFTYTPSSQNKDVTLSLGSSVTASFSVTAGSGTPANTYSFRVRVADVRRPNGQGGFASIANQVTLVPASGNGQDAKLTVN